MPTDAADCDFPFKGTEATKMLKAGLERAANERGISTRAAARELGYKATVVISHMATGRVPIPLDRAAEIAEVVGLDPRDFYLAVLEQRHPGAAEILGSGESDDPYGDRFAAELSLLAGCALGALSQEHKHVLREVVAERSPSRRWLSVAELPAILMLRSVRPGMREHGLTPSEIRKIGAVLD
jgi:hypothetical protein